MQGTLPSAVARAIQRRANFGSRSEPAGPPRPPKRGNRAYRGRSHLSPARPSAREWFGDERIAPSGPIDTTAHDRLRPVSTFYIDTVQRGRSTRVRTLR